MEQQNVVIFLPLHKYEKIENGNIVIKEEPLFSGYIFAQIDTENVNWTSVRSTRGVSNIVKFGNDPAVVDQVTIDNQGNEKVKLVNRYWKIIDANGILQEVRGKGVVGEQPILNPGEKYEYTSGTPLTTSSGFMEGSYEMQNDNGDKFNVQIPQFSLDNPFESNQLN